ncbi:type III polyketide synthase [Streptomyces sp. NBC_01433]|uniref:type III polyketide synthase n=1 Tax=Streptomyces sp. NBC_01433 TaxID=2903864 RepID=UPI00224CD4FB|nr:type III polyketide synthase [Streptomyces sp. NBC_01433]MCX4680818.1 type III polyketide synthase [Streptomyces sp. NBC_01433]
MRSPCPSRGDESLRSRERGEPMATLCRPAIAVPEHVITMQQTLDLARETHADHPQRGLVLRLIQNTGVQTRHLVQPIEETLRHPGFEVRNKLYEAEAKTRVPEVVRQALANAELEAAEIDLIVYVSCTGFMMPSLTAWLINSMGFRSETRQLPIAQLGCAAGGAAINRAHDFCLAYPRANVLIVSCEFCSLCYQPTDIGVGSLLSNGLFGDAVSAAVVRGQGGTGMYLERNGSHLVPDTEDWISYAVRDTGFHFLLDKRVPGTMEMLAPVLKDLVDRHGWTVPAMDFFIVHAGGPRILDDLCHYLNLPPEMFRFSRATLTERGNIASSVVFDALARLFEDGCPAESAQGLIAGFGPGITAEVAVGRWAVHGEQARERGDRTDRGLRESVALSG